MQLLILLSLNSGERYTADRITDLGDVVTADFRDGTICSRGMNLATYIKPMKLLAAIASVSIIGGMYTLETTI